MLNWVFLLLVLGSVVTAAFGGAMKLVTDASISSAKSAVDLALGLVGQMAIWLGFMRVLQDAGLMASLARGLAPLMRRLFPDVPAEHPAMGAMIMNLSANILGLGNAATPFGLKAMVELDKLNARPGVATNAMVLFLAINTSGVAVLPLGAVAIRATLGSNDPAGIVLPSLLATMASTLVAVLAVKLLQRRPGYGVEHFEATEVRAVEAPSAEALAKAQAVASTQTSRSTPRNLAGFAVVVAVGVALARATRASELGGLELARQVFSDWLLPILMLAIVMVGFVRGVKVYESFIAGAKESFQIAITIIPFLVAILVAIGMFRASGGMEVLVSALSPITALIGMPAEALPMALIRPLSGSGAMAVMTEAMKANGPDSLVGYMVCVMNGATETTFYVLAVYYGAVGVRATRHTVAACLTSEAAGMLAAVWFTRLFFA